MRSFCDRRVTVLYLCWETYLHILHDCTEMGTNLKKHVHAHSIVYIRKVSFSVGDKLNSLSYMYGPAICTSIVHECPPTNCLSPTNKLTWLGWHGRVQHQSSQRLIVFSMVPPCLIWLVWLPDFCVKTRGEIHISPITTCLFCQFVFLRRMQWNKRKRRLKGGGGG